MESDQKHTLKEMGGMFDDLGRSQKIVGQPSRDNVHKDMNMSRDQSQHDPNTNSRVDQAIKDNYPSMDNT